MSETHEHGEPPLAVGRTYGIRGEGIALALRLCAVAWIVLFALKMTFFADGQTQPFGPWAELPGLLFSVFFLLCLAEIARSLGGESTDGSPLARGGKLWLILIPLAIGEQLILWTRAGSLKSPGLAAIMAGQLGIGLWAAWLGCHKVPASGADPQKTGSTFVGIIVAVCLMVSGLGQLITTFRGSEFWVGWFSGGLLGGALLMAGPVLAAGLILTSSADRKRSTRQIARCEGLADLAGWVSWFVLFVGLLILLPFSTVLFGFDAEVRKQFHLNPAEIFGMVSLTVAVLAWFVKLRFLSFFFRALSAQGAPIRRLTKGLKNEK